ncbi:hypothetical protein DPMN_085790 [Dreissena polymorpha]|uniref:Uncharacterized protein n=1 Tax=Dreissena polymorpha TaxID=45954 RepID=A0A9D4BD59_DREPO|nr:hypothetical protein DPMN_085790 [Dreissena polymorpha]
MKRRGRVVRNIWVRDWISRGLQLGFYDLMVELSNEDPKAFQNSMRMPPAMYDEIVKRMTPALTKETSFFRFSTLIFGLYLPGSNLLLLTFLASHPEVAVGLQLL